MFSGVHGPPASSSSSSSTSADSALGGLLRGFAGPRPLFGTGERGPTRKRARHCLAHQPPIHNLGIFGSAHFETRSTFTVNSLEYQLFFGRADTVFYTT